MNENRDCPYCESQDSAYVLGNLGQTVHYRCQNCGIQFSVTPKKKFKSKKQAKREALDLRAARRFKQSRLEGE